ncbi:S41 family peptidase [Sphingomonas sp. PvP056]|uniref:S41 family peptidase n=1 Tax=Sphingomonas sp. PvP056 TaxID=3156392 RepID=UPI0033941DC0
MTIQHVWSRGLMGLSLLLLPFAVGCPAWANPAVSSPPALIGAEAMRADFRALYARLRSAQYAVYARTSKAVLDRAFAAELATLNHPMPLVEVQTRFQRFVAKIKVAHTRIAFPTAAYDRYTKAGNRIFPLELRIDAGRAFVIAPADGEANVAVGDEIVRLNGTPMPDVLSRLGRNVSADTPYLAHSIIEYRLPAYLWLEYGAQPVFELTVRRPDGNVRKVKLAGRTAAEIAAIRPAPRPDPVRVAKMLPEAVAYLRPGPFYNIDAGANPWDTRAFTAYVDSAFRGFLAAGATTLLIDLRNNPGGDASFSDPMIAWFATRPFRFVSDFRIRISDETVASNLARMAASARDGVADFISPRLADLYANAKPGSVRSFPVPLTPPRTGERFTGKVYVLIDRYSYSNTVSVAAIVQDYRFGTILGEETTDLATTYGAMESFTLPRTGIVVGYAKAMLIRPSGSLVARGIVPDIPLRAPLGRNDDDMLDRALAAIRTGRAERAYRHASR